MSRQCVNRVAEAPRPRFSNRVTETAPQRYINRAVPPAKPFFTGVATKAPK